MYKMPSNFPCIQVSFRVKYQVSKKNCTQLVTVLTIDQLVSGMGFPLYGMTILNGSPTLAITSLGVKLLSTFGATVKNNVENVHIQIFTN